MRALLFKRNLFIGLICLFVELFFLMTPDAKADGNILVYATEDGSGGPYDKSVFDTNLPSILGNHGYSVTVTDRITTPTITASLLSSYNELWIMSSKRYTTGVFSTDEINAILDFRSAGHGLLIMADHYDYVADANQISIPLGVTFYGLANHGPAGGLIQPVFQSHPLFAGVTWIVAGCDEGQMNVNSPVQVVATYQGDNLIAALDNGTGGRVVFDVSFERMEDDGVVHWITLGDTPQYARNIADWLMSTNQPPTAVIDDISPNPAELGEQVNFVGHGVDSDGSIVGYNWRSNIDGQLSTQASFSTNTLSSGAHTIYFKVQDNDEAWSEEVSQILEVDPGSENWTVQWSYPPSGQPFAILMHDAYNGSLLATNNTTQPRVFNYGLSKSYTALSWSGVEVDPDWDLAESTVCFLDGETYAFGNLLPEVVGPNETKGYTFSLKNDWNWIEPWDLWRIVDIVVDVLLCGGSSIVPQLEDLIHMYDYMGFLQESADFLHSAPQLKYTYAGLGDANAASQDNVHVWVRPEKIVLYWLSYGSAFLAGEFTSAGFDALPIPFVGWAIAAALFASEAATYVCSEVFYITSVDPDSNFTELASPQLWHEPVLDTLPPGPSKTTAELTFNLLSITQALKASYGRYLGALRAGSAEWATVQLGASRFYTEQEIPIAHQLDSLTQIIVDSIPIPSPEQIAATRDSLMQNGLPEVEVEIMHRLGFTDAEIDSLTAIYIHANDEFYTSFVNLPQMAEYFGQSLQSLVTALPQPPGEAKLADLGTYPDTLNIYDPPAILNCWVEFPKDSSITGYQIISAVLNDTIQASYISPTPGDYDHDGIPDIAMQFSTNMLIPMLQPGQRLLSVLGNIVLPTADTVLYSGSALLTVLEFMRGDANGDGLINVSDVVYLINYLFISGPAPQPLAAGDCNCDGVVNVSDVVYLINYLFISGPPPCK